VRQQSIIFVMVYIVEVRRIGHDLPAMMAEMRTWLDHSRAEIVAFEYSAGGPGIAFRISFSTECDALAFAQAFGGRLTAAKIRAVRRYGQAGTAARTADPTTRRSEPPSQARRGHGRAGTASRHLRPTVGIERSRARPGSTTTGSEKWRRVCR
jgi:hypothetical protein